MPYNLTEDQQDVLRWFARAHRDGHINDELGVGFSTDDNIMLVGYTGEDGHPALSKRSAWLALGEEGLLRVRDGRTSGIMAAITQRGLDAVDSDFDSPDAATVRRIGPLPELGNLNPDLRDRCLPPLANGGTPQAWDSAVRTAFAYLEQRMRDAHGGAQKLTGVPLANALFGSSGTFASHLSDSECQGYRGLFAGAFSLIRNDYAHGIVDPEPEVGAELLLLANLLLRRLNALTDGNGTT